MNGGEGWSLALRAADVRLRPVLDRGLVGFRQDSPGTSIEAAVPALTLMVGLGGSLQGDGVALPDAWVGGLSDRHTLVELGVGYTSLDIKLTPLGAYSVLGRPLSELAGRVVPVQDVLDPGAAALTEQLREASDWDRRFHVLERFLLERAASGPAPNPTVRQGWERLCASRGRVRIEALARELGCSRHYLARGFHEQIGCSPKTAARLLRFQHVCRRLRREPGRWVEIAYEAGYSDQPHMNRDFRDLAGTTPTAFLAKRLPGRGMVGDEIPFVQD